MSTSKPPITIVYGDDSYKMRDTLKYLCSDDSLYNIVTVPDVASVFAAVKQAITEGHRVMVFTDGEYPVGQGDEEFNSFWKDASPDSLLSNGGKLLSLTTAGKFPGIDPKNIFMFSAGYGPDNLPEQYISKQGPWVSQIKEKIAAFVNQAQASADSALGNLRQQGKEPDAPGHSTV